MSSRRESNSDFEAEAIELVISSGRRECKVEM